MVAHVLINGTPGNVDGLVIRDLLDNFSETFQSFLKRICPVQHETQVESAADEVFLKFQSLIIHVNCFFIQILVVLPNLLEYEFRLTLISQAFRMPELGVRGRDA